MENPKPEFPELVPPPGAEWGIGRQMSGVSLKAPLAKSMSMDESFAGQLANDEAAHQEWLEKVHKLRLSCKTAT